MTSRRRERTTICETTSDPGPSRRRPRRRRRRGLLDVRHAFLEEVAEAAGELAINSEAYLSSTYWLRTRIAASGFRWRSSTGGRTPCP
jgi:hypothetical protein